MQVFLYYQHTEAQLGLTFIERVSGLTVANFPASFALGVPPVVWRVAATMVRVFSRTVRVFSRMVLLNVVSLAVEASYSVELHVAAIFLPLH